MYQVIMLYPLNLYTGVCQLYLNKPVEKISSNLGFISRLSDVASTACGSRMSQRLLAFGLEGVESDI